MLKSLNKVKIILNSNSKKNRKIKERQQPKRKKKKTTTTSEEIKLVTNDLATKWSLHSIINSSKTKASTHIHSRTYNIQYISVWGTYGIGGNQFF